MAAAVLLLVTSAAGLAEASRVEDLTGAHYQTDGDGAGDAPDACRAGPAFPPGEDTGLLVPFEDEVDHYALELGEDEVGELVVVRVVPHGDRDLDLAGFTPGCQEPVTRCPEPDDGTALVCASVDDHSCEDDAWHFVINQLHGLEAPSSIHVVWANGDEADVALDKRSGPVAHYETQRNLDTPVAQARAELPEAWEGRFNLGSGPCIDEGGDVLAFVPGEAGAHVIATRLAETTAPEPPDEPGAEPPDAAGTAFDPTGPQPTACHGVCAPLLETVDAVAGYEMVRAS